MGTIHKRGKLTIRVNGQDHPPVHAHVTHPDGNAMVFLNGKVKNSGVPAADLAFACEWIAAHEWQIRQEWNHCN